MSNRDAVSRLRQEIGRLAAEFDRLREQMLHPGGMIPASLIARRLGTRRQKRASTAHYLSWAEAGKTVLRHVCKEDLDPVRAKVEAWRAYRRRLRRCRQVLARLVELLDRLGQELAERPAQERRR